MSGARPEEAGVTPFEANPYAATTVELAQDTAPQKLELASRWSRLAAVVVNGVLVLLSGVPWLLGSQLVGDGALANALYLLVAFGVPLGFVYYNCLLLEQSGQTVAKRLLGIRVVRRDGTYCGAWHYVVARFFPAILLSFVPLGSLLDASMIFRESRRCLHDDWAGTRVVKA
ncbi:RDD family protein [Chitiniphilus shinanonensis]|uniref:RDD family protein n=1 Tax=Chitiniphilus shinanonensis TaxID=553088 RepID=UPI0033400E6A